MKKSKDNSRVRLDDPVQTQVHQSRRSTHSTMSTLALSTKIRSSEWSRARQPAIVDYGKGVEQIGRPRAQKRSPAACRGYGSQDI